MPAVWNHETELKLCMAIIHVSEMKPSHWETVANKMGEGFSTEACRQHFRKSIAKKYGDGPDLSPRITQVTSNPYTPIKASKAKYSRKRKAKEMDPFNDGEDGKAAKVPKLTEDEEIEEEEAEATSAGAGKEDEKTE